MPPRDTPASLPPVIEALLDLRAYPHAVRRVTLVQTHISYVLLAGRYAYKVKKAVDLGFLDYSTLERRQRLCEDEVRLNRRLCAGVYLAVVPVVRAGRSYRIDGDGAPVEYAVAMRRVPARRMMPSLLERGLVMDAHIRSLARVVAEFHRTARTGARIAAFGRPAAVRRTWRENLAQVRPFIGDTVAPDVFAVIEAYVDAFLRGHAALIEARAEGGHVRDVHGDLRADGVVFDRERASCIMDCIEFSERLRCGDVASDVAFMAMDLERRGYRALAESFVALYLEQRPDETLPAVLNFYRCYRAFVRGKVHSIEATAPEVPAKQRASARAAAVRCFTLALSYASPRPRALVAMCGLSGTGKSYVAAALASRLGAVLISSDVVRKGLLGVDVRAPVTAAYGAGVYGPAERARVYEAMRERAARYIAEGYSVVLDATHERRADRDAARELARSNGVPALLVRTSAGEAQVRRRLATRDEARAVSGARWDTYLEQRARFEPPAPEESAFDVSPRLALDRQVDRIVAALARPA